MNPFLNYLDKATLIGNCKLLRLSRVDTQPLLEEIKTIPPEFWNEDFRADVHRDTQSVFLRGYPPIKNIPEDIDRLLLSRLPKIRRMISTLVPGQLRKCLIARLNPNGRIPIHEDGAPVRIAPTSLIYDYFKSTIRIHIPLETNDQVLFYVGGKFHRMAAGEVWAINNLAPHGVVNNHDQLARLHLILDVIPDESFLSLLSHSPAGIGWPDPIQEKRLLVPI